MQRLVTVDLLETEVLWNVGKWRKQRLAFLWIFSPFSFVLVDSEKFLVKYKSFLSVHILFHPFNFFIFFRAFNIHKISTMPKCYWHANKCTYLLLFSFAPCRYANEENFQLIHGFFCNLKSDLNSISFFYFSKLVDQQNYWKLQNWKMLFSLVSSNITFDFFSRTNP